MCLCVFVCVARLNNLRLVGLVKQAEFLLANWQTTRETYDLMIHIKTGVENMNLKILCPTVACGMFAHGGQHVRARSKLPLQRRTMVQNVALCMRQIVFYDGAIWACMGRGVPCRGNTQKPVKSTCWPGLQFEGTRSDRTLCMHLKTWR